LFFVFLFAVDLPFPPCLGLLGSSFSFCS
jgi:hypothetical protein